jgi:UDP-N-acetylmuramate--alanine ligase
VKIFFSGIGGNGVSALAGFTADRGHEISGSDRLFDINPEHQICTRLRSKGIRIFPQDGTGIDGSCDLAVFSTAVEKTSPDFIKAEKVRISIKTRPEYLAGIVSEFETVAVAGTSGKSTISGMLAFLMQKLGMEPNFIGGGRVKQFKSSENPGNYLTGSSRSLIIEACESDGTIVNYRPTYSIIANLALDHHPVKDTAVMFEKLSGNTSGFVVIGGDDENLNFCSIKKAVRFSIDNKSDYQANDINYHPFKTLFSLKGQRFELPLPGKHNLYNALACAAFLSELGVPPAKISEALGAFSGVERRFDIHLDNGSHVVVDDYAHNPHKIANLMKTMRGISKRVCYIFQPHGFGPTRLMKDGYIETFSANLRETDHLVLLPIYYAGGTASKDVSSRDISEGVTASKRSAEVFDSRDDFFSLPLQWDSYVVFGARDDSLSDLADKIAEHLRN